MSGGAVDEVNISHYNSMIGYGIPFYPIDYYTSKPQIEKWMT